MEREPNWTHGAPADAVPKLKAKLTGYLSHWGEVYIGATSDLERRARKHEDERHPDKMVALYEVYKHEDAVAIERAMIEFTHGTRLRVVPMNRARGGEGLIDGTGPWVIYVLLTGSR